MPNPYHDESGKFCSANEMQAAVKRLAGNGKFQEAFILSQEFAAIGQHNLREAEEQLASFRGSISLTQPARKSNEGKGASRYPKRQPAGPRGYTTGSRQASAAAQATRKEKLPAAPASRPVAPAVAQPAPAATPSGPPPKLPTGDTILIGSKAPRSELIEHLQSLSQNEALNLVRESGSARLAIVYADLHGWPERSEGFDSLVLDDAAMTPARQHLVAHRVQTQSAMNRIVNNRAATSNALSSLAANRNLSPHVAVRLIDRAEAHPQAYAQIRESLLGKSGAASYLLRHLAANPVPSAVNASPARLEDLSARVKRFQRELDVLTSSGTKEPLGTNRQRVAHLTQQVAAARAALIASDPQARAALSEASASGNQQARVALAAARSYSIQQQDIENLRAARDLA